MTTDQVIAILALFGFTGVFIGVIWMSLSFIDDMRR